MTLPRLATAALMLASTSVLAQPTEAAPPPPPASETTLAPAPTAPPALTEATGHRVRVRWGIDGMIGYHHPAQAVTFGGSARIGAQIFNELGVYLDFGYLAGIGFGGNFSGTGGTFSVSGVGIWHLAPMVEGDFGKWFIAAGPLLGGGGWGQIIQGVDINGDVVQTAIATGGIMPGVDIRTGFTFGDRQPSGRRHGFTLAIDVKVFAAGATRVDQSAGSSGVSQSVSVGDRVWGVAPMLVLGYDSK